MEPMGIRGPYEEAAIQLIGLIAKVIDGQPPEVRAKLWEMYLEDVREWRAFWARLKPPQ
jgi:hypothetical protein